MQDKDHSVDTGLISATLDLVLDTNGEQQTAPLQGTDLEDADMSNMRAIKPVLKQKRKTKGVSSAVQAKKSQIARDVDSALTSSQCEHSDDCDSDFSLASEGTKPASHEKMAYSARLIKQFLQDTKNMKGVKLEEHFSKKKGFYDLAMSYLRSNEDGVFTDQEDYRLKKLVLKVKRDLHPHDDSRANDEV